MPNSVSRTTRPAVASRPSERFRAESAGTTNVDTPSRPRTKAVPWGVAGMVVLIVVIESVVARNWLDFTDPVSLSWRYSALSARSRVCEKDLLLLGDSLIKHALIPSVITGVSGARAENLGAARCPTLMTYFLLRRCLDSSTRPAPLYSTPSQPF